MTDAAPRVPSDANARAGIPTRLIAFALDIAIVKLAVVFVAIVIAAVLTDSIRLASPVVSSQSCGAYGPPPRQIQSPSEYQQLQVRTCSRGLWGILRDDRLVVRATIGPGGDAQDVDYFPVDRAGRPASPAYLDDATPLLLAAYLILFESTYGTSIGKWFLALLVRSARGGRITLAQATQRTAYKFAVLLPIPITATVLGAAETSTRYSLDLAISRISTLESYGVQALQFVSALLVIAALVAALRRAPLPHDRWAGTVVDREFRR